MKKKMANVVVMKKVKFHKKIWVEYWKGRQPVRRKGNCISRRCETVNSWTVRSRFVFHTGKKPIVKSKGK